MTFGKQNSTLGSVVPLAMFLRIQVTMYPVHDIDIHLTRRSKRRRRMKNEEDNDDLVLVRGSGALGRYSSRQPGGESLALSFTIYTTIIFYIYNLHHLLHLHYHYYLHHFHHLHYPHHWSKLSIYCSTFTPLFTTEETAETREMLETRETGLTRETWKTKETGDTERT